MKRNALLTLTAATALFFAFLPVSCIVLPSEDPNNEQVDPDDPANPDNPGNTGGTDNPNNSGTTSYNGIGLPTPKPEDPIKAEVTGDIDPETFDAQASSIVTFSRIPYSLDEFKDVYAKIGGTPAGAVAVQLMAMEMYHRQHDVGLEALTLCNTKGNMQQRYGDQLNQLFKPNDKTDYARPYQVASFLKGANYKNGYLPETPYTIEVKTNASKPYAWSNDYEAYVIYLTITQNVKEENGPAVTTRKQAVNVLRAAGKEQFQVFEGAGLITQCVKISATATYTDLK